MAEATLTQLGEESVRSSASVRKLSSEDQWETWKWQIELCLKEQCLYSIADGTRKCPAAPVGEEEPSDAYRRWQRDNARAARIIGTALDDEPSIYVRRKTDANDIWETLISVYEQSSLQRLYTLFDTFFEVTKDEFTSVTKHTSKLANLFDDICSELTKGNPDAKLPISLLHHRIFKTLGQEYQYYRSTWYRIPKAEQTTKLLIENLRSIENSLSTHGNIQTGSSFLSKAKFDNQKQGNISSSSKTKRKENRSCLYCKKVGHIIANCRKRVEAEKSKQTIVKNSSDSRTSNPGSFLATSLLVNEDFVSTDSWISDSGTTHHMTANKQHFATFEQFPIPQRVQTAGNEVISAYGSGRVDIEVFINGRWSSAVLNDVWYVPDARHQLFSVRKAAEQGNDITFDNKGVIVRHKGQIAATGKLRGPIYIMNIRVKSPKSQVEVYLATPEEFLQGWHERLGHQDKRHIRNVLSRFGIAVKCSDTASFCDGCVLGKSHRKPFRSRDERPVTVGEVIHADVNGPMSVNSINGFRYYVVFKDDYSRFVRIFFMKNKSEVVEHLKTFLRECDTCGHKVKAFRSDGGREFDCSAVLQELRERGIEFRLTCPYTPEQNGVAEQSNRHIVELARSMLSVSKLPRTFWAHACDTAVYLVNRTGKSSVQGKTPSELWSGRTFKSFDHLRIFGSECYVNIPKQFRTKFDDKAVFGNFVGYVNDKDGYKIWVPSKHRVIKSRNVDFRPEKLCTSNNTIQLEFEDPVDIKENEEKEADEQVISEEEEQAGIEEVGRKRPVREIRRPSKFDDFIVGYQAHRAQNNSAQSCLSETILEEFTPTNFDEAMRCQDSAKWMSAMREEINAFAENDTWDLVQLPTGKRAIDNRWVLRVKYKSDGSIDRYRARLVVRGIFQRAGLDYDETFSPVARYDAIRCVLAIAAKEKLVLGQFDVKTAFLHGDIDAEIFMTQPEGFDDGSGRVCRLKKSLYGLKQSPRCWNDKFNSFMVENDFIRSTADPCIYVRSREKEKLLVAIYVDDGLIAGSTNNAVNKFLDLLKSKFQITIGSLDSFLGMQIEQRESSLFVSQTAYTEKILQRFDMAESKPMNTPAENNRSENQSMNPIEKSIPYRSAVGSLMYLACATRPDIAYAVSKVARSMAEPTSADWISVKRIFRYLRGTTNHGLLYTSSEDELCAYSDADLAGDPGTRRSTNGFVSLIGGTAVSWTSQLQKSVALSTTEAEFVAASEGAKELIWLKRLLNEICGKSGVPVLFVDNASAIKLVKNPEFHKRSKHIEVRYYFVRELFQNGDIFVEHVSSENQLGDMFTKPLNAKKFSTLCNKIGLSK